MGKTSAYGFTDSINAPSLKIKDKLGAVNILKGVYVELFRKYKKSFILKVYDKQFLEERTCQSE